MRDSVVWTSICLAAPLVASACASAPREEPAPVQASVAAPVEPPTPAPQADAPGPAPASSVPPTATAAPTPPPWTGAREVTSNGGAYVVRWTPTPAEIPRGPLFAIDAWVFDARDRERALADVDLVVDAAMPEHLHGMNRVPTIAKRPDGAFRVDGMKLHMPGNWDLYFDVVRGPIAERAQVRVELE